MNPSPRLQAARLAEGAKQQFSGDVWNRSHTGDFIDFTGMAQKQNVHRGSVKLMGVKLTTKSKSYRGFDRDAFAPTLALSGAFLQAHGVNAVGDGEMINGYQL